MVCPSRLGALAPQKQEAVFPIQEERPSLWGHYARPGLERSPSRGQKLRMQQLRGDGEQCGHARTPPGALPGKCQEPDHHPGLSTDDPRKLRGSERGRPPAGRGSLGGERKQSPGTNDTRRMGSLAFDRLADISQASRAFKHTQGLNYSESSAETIRIKERKADGAIK